MISGFGDEVEDTEDGCRALILLFLFLLFFPMYVYVCVCVCVIPGGRLLISEMSRWEGELMLVHVEAFQHNGVITQCVDQQQDDQTSNKESECFCMSP